MTTYDTLRGTFVVLEERPATHAVLLRRSDNRHVLVSLSDWLTWRPQVHAEGEQGTTSACDDVNGLSAGKVVSIVDTLVDS